MTDEFLITYSGRTGLNNATFHNETFEGEVPATLGEVVGAVFDQLDSWEERLTGFRVIQLTADTQRFENITEDVISEVRRTAEEGEFLKVLAHPLISPDGFCPDCFTSGRKCMGCKLDEAA